ncbi:MAG: hypothetical protein ABW185_03945 [Sedimenticola sp.]
MDGENRHIYLLLIGIHGLIRGHDLEWGRDADGILEGIAYYHPVTINWLSADLL